MRKRGVSFVAGSMLFWILAIIALILTTVLIVALQGKAGGALDYLSRIFGWR